MPMKRFMTKDGPVSFQTKKNGASCKKNPLEIRQNRSRKNPLNLEGDEMGSPAIFAMNNPFSQDIEGHQVVKSGKKYIIRAYGLKFSALAEVRAWLKKHVADEKRSLIASGELKASTSRASKAKSKATVNVNPRKSTKRKTARKSR